MAEPGTPESSQSLIDVEGSSQADGPAYVCHFDDCHAALGDRDEVLDHVEEHSRHAACIRVLRPQVCDHVYINRVETLSPLMRQHHGIVVPSSGQKSIRICHFATCDQQGATITVSTVVGFSNGLDLFLVPTRATRSDPQAFALACVGKSGFDSRSFNCEHFVNLCLTSERRSDMNNRAFWILTSVAGTALTTFGGAVGAGVWLAGKTAYVSKLMMDNFGSKGGLDITECTVCSVCESNQRVTVVPQCGHIVCEECGVRIGANRVCPVANCYENFFRFTVTPKR